MELKFFIFIIISLAWNSSGESKDALFNSYLVIRALKKFQVIC